MKKATTPITATPPATLRPMIEPVPKPEPESLSLDALVVALEAADVPESDPDAVTMSVVCTTEPCELVV